MAIHSRVVSTGTYDYVTYIPSINTVREREIRPAIEMSPYYCVI